MSTTTTNTFQDQSTNANFQAWVNEVYNALVTTLGLTHTADTGQMAVPCVTAAPSGASQSAGYYVFRFNDTLQATAPIFLKLEFGSGASGANFPQMFITVGTGTNGAGTVNGVAMVRSAVGNGSTNGQATTNYNSYYCYNTAQGFLGATLKLGMGGTNESTMGFMVWRSVDATGAPTGDSIHLLTNINTANGGVNYGYMQCINNNTAAVQTLTAANMWGDIPFSTNYSQEGTAAMVFPVYQYKGTASAPGFGITNALALAVDAEITVGNTAACTILGSLSLTYINVGGALGAASLTAKNYNASTFGLMMLWQ